MPKMVLIVEDVADIRMIMKMLVESFGYRAITADDGYEAIEKAVEFHPDLILMDIMMPILDGIDATRIIRRINKDKVPILAVTAYDNNYHQKALEAGCNEVLQKPLDFENFKPLLRQYLS
jgi:CheY-like chemotaxis protein